MNNLSNGLQTRSEARTEQTLSFAMLSTKFQLLSLLSVHCFSALFGLDLTVTIPQRLLSREERILIFRLCWWLTQPRDRRRHILRQSVVSKDL
jgi:hypothetical protein